MVITSGMMSSNTAEWSTPQDLFDRLDKEFHFGTDICATAENAKCPRYFTKEQDGLAHMAEWTGAVWCNPPYGREIGRWVKACADYAEGGGIAVCLVPARTDTRWWREHCMRATEIRLVAGRLRFGDATASAPFPSAIAVFGTPRMPTFRMVCG